MSNRFKGARKSPKKKPNTHPLSGSEPIILEERVFPVYGAVIVDCCPENRLIRGTCFSIGEPYFITAAHVVSPDDRYPLTRIGYMNQIRPGYVEEYDLEICEIWPESDMALVKCIEIYTKERKPKPFIWTTRKLKFFETIRAMGYPFGYDNSKKYTTGRAFEGTKVGNINYDLFGINAWCYELSFHCLRGLSGTCLLDKNYKVHGMVFRNTKEELEVFRETETVQRSDTQVQETVITNETRFIGMAIEASHIFQIQSQILGCSLEGWLKKMNLLTN